jgi:hypothetical protein
MFVLPIVLRQTPFREILPGVLPLKRRLTLKFKEISNMNSETFAVVTTDGREHPAVDMETIKRWYVEKHLNDDSLIFSSEAGDWRLLGWMFDMSQAAGSAGENQPVYFEEITSLAVPPDADFETIQHVAPEHYHALAKPQRRSIPGLTALATLAVFSVFGAITYLVLVNFVFYQDTISFSNNSEITALKTQVIGKPFNDPSGVKINLPGGWSLVSPNTPEAKVQAPDAKMFAVNFDKKMFAALQVLPADTVKAHMKEKMSELLQKYRVNTIGPFSVIADYDVQIGNYPARKSIFSRRDRSVDASTTTHLIAAQDKNNLYIFQIWAPSDKYSALSADFDQTEKTLSLP